MSVFKIIYIEPTKSPTFRTFRKVIFLQTERVNDEKKLGGGEPACPDDDDEDEDGATALMFKRTKRTKSGRREKETKRFFSLLRKSQNMTSSKNIKEHPKNIYRPYCELTSFSFLPLRPRGQIKAKENQKREKEREEEIRKERS